MSLVLIVRLAGERVALRADAVASVVELDEITPVPRAAAHVAGLAALRSRVLTVIDTYRSIGLASLGDDGREAVVVERDGHHYALLVDSIDDVMDASDEDHGTRTPMSARWANVATGTVEAGCDILLLLDIDALVAGRTQAAAA